MAICTIQVYHNSTAIPDNASPIKDLLYVPYHACNIHQDGFAKRNYTQAKDQIGESDSKYVRTKDKYILISTTFVRMYTAMLTGFVLEQYNLLLSSSLMASYFLVPICGVFLYSCCFL